MSNPYFQFKQFTLWHDRCAMPVGTDGVLLGAWVATDNLALGARPRILDVGTGTGLIALMLAQRLPRAQVVGVEIDPSSAGQAEENVVRSPFASRVEVIHADFLAYTDSVGFDLVVSNPPFFTETLQCPDPERNRARHVDALDWATLLAHSAAMLRPAGRVALILPANAEAHAVAQARRVGLVLRRRTRVRTRPHKPCCRVLMEWILATTDPLPHDDELCICDDDLCLEDAEGKPTPAYRALTQAFYLKF